MVDLGIKLNIPLGSIKLGRGDSIDGIPAQSLKKFEEHRIFKQEMEIETEEERFKYSCFCQSDRREIIKHCVNTRDNLIAVDKNGQPAINDGQNDIIGLIDKTLECGECDDSNTRRCPFSLEFNDYKCFNCLQLEKSGKPFMSSSHRP